MIYGRAVQEVQDMQKVNGITLHLLSEELVVEALVASLHLSEIRSIILTLRIDGGTERFST